MRPSLQNMLPNSVCSWAVTQLVWLDYYLKNQVTAMLEMSLPQARQSPLIGWHVKIWSRVPTPLRHQGLMPGR